MFVAKSLENTKNTVTPDPTSLLITAAKLVYPSRLFFVIVIADLCLTILLPQMLSYSILLC